MSKYVWTTDIHLDHLKSDDQIVEFASHLIEKDPTGVFITGDISMAPSLIYHLSIVERVVQRPVYFVCGNHDYFRGDIDTVRKAMRELTNVSQFLKYMPLTPYVALSPATALVGHDGWYDALNGDVQNSSYLMADWSLIGDFIPLSGGGQFMNARRAVLNKPGIINLSRKLAHESVTHVQNGIKKASRYHSSIVVLTHVVPFEQAHIYKGKVGDAGAQPWFTSQMMGTMLLEAAKAYPNIHFNVLCGHTHGRYDGKVASNMELHVGYAAYGRPDIAGFIDVP